MPDLSLEGASFWLGVVYFHAIADAEPIVRLACEGLLRCHPGTFGSFPGSELGRYLTTDDGEVLELSGETV